jgi:hypothetical protein
MVVGIVFLSQALEENGGGEVIIPPQATARAAPQSGSVLGDDDATVTIVEYSWYNCHVCRDFTLQMLPQIERDYIETGRVRLELRPIAAEEALDELPLDARTPSLRRRPESVGRLPRCALRQLREGRLDAYKKGG